MEIPGEKQYPIYTFKFVWSADDCEHDWTCFDEMKRVEMSDVELDAYALELWQQYTQKQRNRADEVPLIEKHPHLLEHTAVLKEHETWCQVWFNHYTFNIHLSDYDVRRSFQQFVDRKQALIDAAGGRESHDAPYCLMGAEDNWRWKGPCRCEHCQARGVVFMDH